MPRQSNPGWSLHTNVLQVINTGSQKGTGTRQWQCKYCGDVQTSTITRVKKHLTGIGCADNTGACKQIPERLRDELRAEWFPTMSASSSATRGSRSAQDALHDAMVGDLDDTETEATTDTPTSSKRSRVGVPQ